MTFTVTIPTICIVNHDVLWTASIVTARIHLEAGYETRSLARDTLRVYADLATMIAETN